MNSVAALDPSPVRPALCFEDVNLDATELHDEPAPHFTLCLVLQGEARLSHRIDDRWHTDWLRPGMFAPITPPHAGAALHLSQAQRHLMISIGADAVARVAAETGQAVDQLEPLQARSFKDPFLSDLCRRAWVETRATDALGRRFARSAEEALICGLLRLATAPSDSPRRRPPAALPAAMLKRIHECCIEHLNEPLEVADLAAIAGMGAQRFGAAFKAATGRSPQQYLIGLRVDQARDLLVNSRLVIAEIALRCGFFDQSHLTTTFTRRVGVPPLRYRRQATR